MLRSTHTSMKIWSSAFVSSPDWATLAVSLRNWDRITEDNPGSRLVCEMTHRAKKVYIALGTPNAEVTGDDLYAPNWILDNLGVSGSGEEVEVNWLTDEAFPAATRIVLRPHDSAFYAVDAKEELESALTRLAVVRQGDTLLIPLAALGDYEVAFDVVITEPANVVLAHGDEVVMEFEEALDTPPPVVTPLPVAEPEPEPEPVAEPVQQGIMLGGDPNRIMPDGRRWNPWRDGPWEPQT